MGMTTLYVGKIPPTVENDFLISLFQTCGNVNSWRTMVDPNTGKHKGFGFVDFASPDSVLLALRFLNGLKVDSSYLMLKVNKATQVFLDAHLASIDRKINSSKEDILQNDDNHLNKVTTTNPCNEVFSNEA